MYDQRNVLLGFISRMYVEFKLCTQGQACAHDHVMLQDSHMRDLPCRAHIQWIRQRGLTAIRGPDLLLNAGHLVNTLRWRWGIPPPFSSLQPTPNTPRGSSSQIIKKKKKKHGRRHPSAGSRRIAERGKGRKPERGGERGKHFPDLIPP